MDSFVCKLIVLENKNLRVLKPKKIDNTDNLPRPSRETTLKKCLFGVSSPADTEKMVQEQYEKDRRRFSERFGIDLDELENLERDSNNENDSGNAAPKERSCGKSRRRILKGKRKTFDERGQLAMTDFYQSRKSLQPSTDKAKDSKEN
nr:uncharacterized protein LOC111518051 [Leptinotarsa decemlineata]